MNPRHRISPRGERGFVLVSVLWILAILTVVSLGFARRSMLERRMAWYALDREQAQQMARAAAERGLIEMRNFRLVSAFDGQDGYTGLDQRWAKGIDLYAEGYFSEANEEFQYDTCSVRIEDVDRYISLQHADPKLLESVKELSSSTLTEILNRRTESTRGYQPALFRTADELRQIQKIPDDQWFGTAKNPGLRSILTAYGDDRDGRINVNTAPRAVLERLPDIEPAVVEAIMKYRNGKDGIPYTGDDQAFRDLSEIGQRLSVSAEKLSPVNNYCKTASSLFTITGHASRRRGKVNAYCTITIDLRRPNPVIVSWREDTVGA